MATEKAPLRLFVAVWPPPDVLDLLAGLPRAEQAGVRWTTPDQWHVTLRFLGAADPDEVSAALRPLGGRLGPVEVVMGPRVGRLGRGVLMVPVAGLDAVAAAVVDVTRHLGHPPEPRPFLGHVTLARLKGAPACGLTDRVVRARWTATELALVRSELHPHGARYTTVATVPFLS
jgi:RNA 2',3'-cyclic 3'-phosphodiesterase